MKKIGIFLTSLFISSFISSLFAINSAMAAGTYMGETGYQSPQRYYQSGGGYYQPQNRGTSGPSNNNYYDVRQSYVPQQSTDPARRSSAASAGKGFYFGGSISHQYAQWNFEMNTTGSTLDYSDVAWNVLDLNGGYKFDKIVLDAGMSYGMQSGSSKMTDDDITNGGLETVYYDDSDPPEEYPTYNKSLSIGESKDGSLFGFNIGVGFADTFGFGKTRMTPSVGYRQFSYELQTTNNYGMAIASNWCDDLGDGQLMCPSFMMFDDNSMTWADPDASDGYYWWEIPLGVDGATMVSNGDNYSFSQSGDTHIYDVLWYGPYLALDFEAEISATDYVTGRIELGFPGYSAEGDQPYRIDWEHPVSVKDEAEMFGGIHLGLAANWTTMFNKNWGMTFGVMYDYYSVSGADAETHNNGDFYNEILGIIYEGGLDGDPDTTIDDWANEEQMYTTNPTAAGIAELYESCGNSWTCTLNSEVDSFYRSIGVRVGVVGKF